jgi:methylated-DNA-[protein]-cysteine S-methyltransferase
MTRTGASAPVFICGRLVRYHRNMDYQAKLSVPFGVLGIRCNEDALTGIDFLPATETPQRAASTFAAKVCEQLLRYIQNSAAQFTVPLDLRGTPHQQKVWRAMLDIPRGQTRSYGELAAELHSSAQAVGQACGANPIPVIVPCHRVVSKSGLGGFMRHASGASLDIKRWLLAHEAVTPSPLYPQGVGRGCKAAKAATTTLQGEGWGEGRSMEVNASSKQGTK